MIRTEMRRVGISPREPEYIPLRYLRTAALQGLSAEIQPYQEPDTTPLAQKHSLTTPPPATPGHLPA